MLQGLAGSGAAEDPGVRRAGESAGRKTARHGRLKAPHKVLLDVEEFSFSHFGAYPDKSEFRCCFLDCASALDDILGTENFH